MSDSMDQAQPPSASTLDGAVAAAASNNSLGCAAAFELAGQFKVTPDRIGRAVDRQGIRLRKCQLGLFGHGLGKKAISAPEALPEPLADAISSASHTGRLPCRNAWRIADQFDWPKPAIAGICDRMAIKIKPCQLGAF